MDLVMKGFDRRGLHGIGEVPTHHTTLCLNDELLHPNEICRIAGFLRFPLNLESEGHWMKATDNNEMHLHNQKVAGSIKHVKHIKQFHNQVTVSTSSCLGPYITYLTR